MRRILSALVGIVSWCGVLRAQDPIFDSVDTYITREMQRQHIPGMSVAILRGDSLLLGRGYGLANVELGVPATDSTIYQSGSVGKQFTAAAVAMLVQRGRLRLEDRIVKWFPEGAGVWDSVTVQHLLTHTSGVAEYTDSTFDYRKDYTEDQLVRFAAARPMDFSPGVRWAYSNTGYLLLGVLIHRVTGRFYGEILRDLIFAPLGMRSTRIISEADIVPNRAAGYQLVKGKLKNQDWVAPSLNTTADGSLYSSIQDLAKWAVSLNQERIPDGGVLRGVWSPVRLNDGGLYPYGFGWELSGQRGHRRIGHTGSWQGFKTAIHRYPEFKLTVVALANLAQAQPGAIAEGIAGILEPALRPPHLLSAPLPGPAPRLPVEQLMSRITEGTDSASVTPAFHRFLSPASRRDLKEALASSKSWKSLGCDELTRRKIAWLGSPIERVCYASATSSDGQMLISVFYTKDWKAAHLGISGF